MSQYVQHNEWGVCLFYASSDLLVIRRKSACNAGVSNLFIIREILFKNESGRDLPVL